ncbi:hypothetical protein [Paenibacillus sp. GCM10028914]|uniref:hypothetical protein n=1 Tax=Paenibacillus sp. GCM10028914 TaxID=3273416 RepID=UPI00361FD0EC
MITWNKRWARPYESYWSIFHKFMLANCINVNQIVQLETAQQEEICTHIDINIKVFKALLSRKNNVPQLKYCSKCAEMGYHSHEHQRYTHCFIHGEPTYCNCQKCSAELKYIGASKDFYMAPFTCICGNTILNNPFKIDSICQQGEKCNIVLQIISNKHSMKHASISISKMPYEVYDLTTVIIDSFLRCFISERFSADNKGTHTSFRGDYFQIETNQIKPSLEKVVEQMFKDNYIGIPFLDFIVGIIRMSLKRFGLRISDYSANIENFIEYMKPLYYLNLQRYTAAKLITNMLSEIVLSNEKILQINLNRIDQNNELPLVPDASVIWYQKN